MNLYTAHQNQQKSPVHCSLRQTEMSLIAVVKVVYLYYTIRCNVRLMLKVQWFKGDMQRYLTKLTESNFQLLTTIQRCLHNRF